jgi:tetratricopeptide (TPR) repeat protein
MCQRGFVTLLSVTLLAGCASLTTQRMARHLTTAMLNQSDPEIVRTGAPAYLLLVDSLIADTPGDVDLLLAGARLYSVYAVGLVRDPERSRHLTSTALEYARRALCIEQRAVCEVLQRPFRELAPALEGVTAGDLPVLYGYATAWVAWIEAHADDWAAMADLPKAERILQRVAQLDPGYDEGRAQLYLGALLALRPAMMGGRPEQAREHFELAIRYSRGHDLMAKVEYARRYARLVFDRDLHDRLLQEVLAADPLQPGLTLSNVIARSEARKLLQDDYF